MRRIISFFLIVVCAISLLSSCGKMEDPSDGDVTFSDGLGNDGAFTVKERKSVYGDEDLVVLYVKNATENEYSVTVTVSFFDTDGKEAAGDMTKTRTVFAELETCYIFRPVAKFDRFEYNLSAEKKDEPSGGGFKYSKQVMANVEPHPVDVHEGRENVRTVVTFPLKVYNYFSDRMMMDGCVILFDNRGEVFGIHEFRNAVPPRQDDYNQEQFDLEGVFWEDGSELPESLEGQLEIAYDFEYSVCDY